MNQAIVLKNICKKYEGFSLQNLSFSQPKGTIMGFIGENGAGKTTTIKLMLNLIHRDQGDLWILGQDPRGDFNEVKESLGVVMDEIGFPENLTATNLNTMMKQIYRSWDENIFDQYLLKFRLPGQKTIKTFSKGMKMKLSLAVALSHHAKLLILDEATSGLDPIVREEIIDFLLEFIQDEDNSVFMSSHIVTDLEKVCDQIAFIHRGKLVFCESKETLREQYGILRCDPKQLCDIPPEIICGQRHYSLGSETLIRKDRYHGDLRVDPASLEEIMIFTAKESK